MASAGATKVRRAIKEFLELDETPQHLANSMAALQKIKAVVDDRTRRISKEAAAMLRYLTEYEKMQQHTKGPAMKKGSGFFEKLLQFDTAPIKLAVSEEINALESAINEAKAKGNERR